MQASVARTLETRYRLLDPRTMGDDPDYTKYGPYAICASLQEEHGKLIADSDLPALANKLPETNNVSPEEKDDKEKNIQCYKCKQWGHKANNPICPLFNKKNDKSTTDVPNDKQMKPKEAWKYVEPKDLTKPIEMDDKKWYFCTKCKCRATGRVGFYQLSWRNVEAISSYMDEG